jgi:uroporphyrinogen III methyltransferase/synthase
LEHDLAKRGALVEKLSVYETIFVKTISASLKQRILSGVDWVTFTSSSTVHSFMRLFSSKERKWIFSVTQAASIGPVTSATLREYGIRPAAEAKSYTAEGLAKAVLNIEFPLPARERVRVRGKCR